MKKIEEINAYLVENEADLEGFYNIGTNEEGEVFSVDILVEWGDWKHSHGRLDYLMKQIGYGCYEQEVTEDDGSDCYSSIHRYWRTE